MEFINGSILCLTGPELLALIPKGTYDSLKNRGKITVHGRGGNGSYPLIEFESLPPAYRLIVVKAYGDPYEYMAKQPIKSLIQPDYKAKQYCDEFISAAGNPLSERHLIEYPNDAAILNALDYLLQDKAALKRTLNVNIGQFWKAACELVKELKRDPRYPNSLPTSERHLKPLFARYKAEGYAALISDRYGNQNTKKHDEEFERMILSLYARPGAKPYAADVLNDYKLFMGGKIELVNAETGELYDRSQFIQDGKPISISQTQVWAIINKPINRATVDAIRNGGLYNSKKHTPLAFRHSPNYAFSKITMDDLQFPFKLKDGEAAVGYQIMDVASGCVIGKAYGKSHGPESGKDRSLFMAAVNDMFRFIVQHGFNVPAEIEVEHHISNTFREDLLKEGYLFPFVRFCRPGNPREKRAEHIFRGKKYQFQHKRDGFHGRFYGRNEANVPNSENTGRKYTFEEVIANENADINAWNNMPHPDQTKYAGMTRMDVLRMMQNPDLSKPNMPLVAKHVGSSTRSAVQINNNQWFWAGGNKYIIPSDVRERLKNRYIMPYWIPAEDGSVTDVYVYQNDTYLCTCKPVSTFNEATAEQTDNDRAIMQDQFAYRKEFDQQIKSRKKALAKIKVVQPYTAPDTAVEVIAEPAPTLVQTSNTDWRSKALSDL